jgi:hypothetical protein
MGNYLLIDLPIRVVTDTYRPDLSDCLEPDPGHF